MKIAHLISSFLPTIGGAEVCAHNIAQRLQAGEHEVTIVTPALRGTRPRTSYEIIDIPRSLAAAVFRGLPFADVAFRAYVTSLQRAHRFDCWQVTIGYPFGVVALPALRACDVPVVLRCTGEDLQIDINIGYGYRRDPSVDRAVRASYPQFDRCIAISPSVVEAYREVGVLEDRIVQIPNGIDVTAMCGVPEDSSFRSRLGIPPSQLLLLAVGRNHPKKGFHRIPSILAHLRTRGVEAAWVLVGDGTDAVRDSAPLGLRASIIPIPAIAPMWDDVGPLQLPPPELHKYYRHADYFVFPSAVETFGIVFLEAMAAGLPVITTNGPGCRDVVPHEECGLQTPVGNDEAMADAVIRCIKEPEIRAKIIRGGHQRAAAYDWDIIAGQYVDCFQGARDRIPQPM
jgi:glycosyltransferase involved in cell wall biosynthesis